MRVKRVWEIRVSTAKRKCSTIFQRFSRNKNLPTYNQLTLAIAGSQNPALSAPYSKNSGIENGAGGVDQKIPICPKMG